MRVAIDIHATFVRRLCHYHWGSQIASGVRVMKNHKNMQLVLYDIYITIIEPHCSTQMLQGVLLVVFLQLGRRHREAFTILVLVLVLVL